MIKNQGCFIIISDNQANIGENELLFLWSNDSKIIIPEGTRMIETNHAIITPKAISSPNSWTILIDVVVNAINPIEVVILVKNMTLKVLI